MRFFYMREGLVNLGQWCLDVCNKSDYEHKVGIADACGIRMEKIDTIRVEVFKEGRPIDLVQAIGSRLVSSPAAATLISQLAPDEVQFFPVRFIGHDDVKGFQLVHLLSHIDCMDESRSKFVSYKGPGDFFGVKQAALREEAVRGHHIFRIKTFSPIVIVSEEFKNVWEAAGLIGPEFREELVI